MNQMPESEDRKALREIPTWTRRYAQTRVLLQIWCILVNIVLCAAIGGLYYLTGVFERSGRTGLALAAGIGALAVIGVMVLVFIYFFATSSGGKKMEQWAENLYGGEGHVGLSDPARMRLRGTIGAAVATVFGIFGFVGLGLTGDIPKRLEEPVSALFLVLFLLIQYPFMRPMVSPIFLLWPALYALHALLVLAGVFSGADSVTFCLPLLGYGLLTLLLTHGYNRYALRRLRKAVRDE